MAHAETDKKTVAGSSLPTTFPERGAHLPFTTPELVHARVRDRRDNAATEVVLPRLIGGRRGHVVPLRKLREAFQLTVHDRALYEQIMATRATTPAKIARIADKLARNGLAGATQMQRARTVRSEHQRARLRQFMFLVGDAVDQLCEDEDQGLVVTPGTLTSSDGLEKAREALLPFAAQHELDGKDLLDRLEKWTKVTACVGSDRGQISGYLLLTTDAMAGLVHNLETWLRNEPEESAEMAEWVVRTCNSALDHANRLVERVYLPATTLGETLIDFDATIRGLHTTVERLIWVIDGWGPLALQWEAVADAGRFAQRDALEDLVRCLPLLPNEMLTNDDRPLWLAFQTRQRSWQKSIDGHHLRQAGAALNGPAPAAARP